MHALPKSSTPDARFARAWRFGCLLLLLLLTVLLALAHGAAKLPTHELLHSPIFWQIRLPRVVACLLSGAALAVSGLLAQTLLSNPLASPTLLGVNSGAGLALALGNVLLAQTAVIPTGALPAFAFAGAVAASLLIYLASLRKGARRGTLLLAGVAISSILSAGIDTLHTLFPNALPGYSSFMLGSFAAASWGRLSPAWLYVLLGLLAAFLLGGALDVFALGDETAQTLGMRVGRTRGAALLVSSVLAGAAVSICGLLSFVGLICPHLARALFRTGRHRVLLPACVLLGAALVTLCDSLSRSLFAPYELPAGIALSFIGGPFFLYLLLRRKKHA
jgi:iron complex transport system permease protein